MEQSPGDQFSGSEGQPALRIVSRRPKRPSRGRAPAWLALAALIATLAVVYVVRRPETRPSGPPSLIHTETGDMVLVPEGAFHHGPSGDTATLPAFYIDRTEVTSAAYERFCRATRRALPPEFVTGQDEMPVVNVSPEDALAFAVWAGKRLPAGLEWEKAARGPEGNPFPWGAGLDRSRLAIGLGQPVHANAFPNGASPYGALQMAGNVWEIVNDQSRGSNQGLERFRKIMSPPPGDAELWYSIRGGGFDSAQLSPHILWTADSIPARWRAADVGFRCARDLQR